MPWKIISFLRRNHATNLQNTVQITPGTKPKKKSKTVKKKNKNNSAPFSDLWRNLAPAPLNFGATLRVPGLLFSLAVGNIHRMSALSNNKQIMGS
jgi:hypothetical protein